jgi:hypothetical protein
MATGAVVLVHSQAIDVAGGFILGFFPSLLLSFLPFHSIPSFIMEDPIRSQHNSTRTSPNSSHSFSPRKSTASTGETSTSQGSLRR